MQFPQTSPQQTQLPLFEAFMAQPLAPILKDVVESPGAPNLTFSASCHCVVQPGTA